MFTRLRKIFLGVAALAALAVGASALAQAGTAPEQKQDRPASEARESNQPENSAADPDNVQDENGKDDASEKGEGKGEEAENSATDPDNVQDENGKDDASETGESEESEGNEVPGDDGPGGHADEPDNPNADHQFEGEE